MGAQIHRNQRTHSQYYSNNNITRGLRQCAVTPLHSSSLRIHAVRAAVLSTVSWRVGPGTSRAAPRPCTTFHCSATRRTGPSNHSRCLTTEATLPTHSTSHTASSLSDTSSTPASLTTSSSSAPNHNHSIRSPLRIQGCFIQRVVQRRSRPHTPPLVLRPSCVSTRCWTFMLAYGACRVELRITSGAS